MEKKKLEVCAAIGIEWVGVKPIRGEEDRFHILDNYFIDQKTRQVLRDGVKENFSGFIKTVEMVSGFGYIFDYVCHNNAYFSLRSFWEGKIRPSSWKGEFDRFMWEGYCLYDKIKCGAMIKDLLGDINAP